MVNAPKVTVMMSAYNAEATVERTIKSVLVQTYKNFEFIAINHGSTDYTKTIVSKYASMDSRVRLMDIPENLGCPARALNIAIQEANGDYLTFIDADDEYRPDFLTTLITMAETYALDVVACSIRRHYDAQSLQPVVVGQCADWVVPEEHFSVDSEHYDRDWLMFLNSFKNDFSLYDYYWNKLYRTEFIHQNSILLPNAYLYYADALFNDAVFAKRPHSAFLKYVGYVHHVNVSSTSFMFHKNQMREIFAYIASRTRWLRYSEGNDTKNFECLILAFISNTLRVKNAPELTIDILQDLEKLLLWTDLCLLMRHQDHDSCCSYSVWLNDLMTWFYQGIRDKTLNQGGGFIQCAYEARAGFPSVEAALEVIFDEKNAFSLGNVQLLDFQDGIQ